MAYGKWDTSCSLINIECYTRSDGKGYLETVAKGWFPAGGHKLGCHELFELDDTEILEHILMEGI
jgi:hypothetical protein